MRSSRDAAALAPILPPSGLRARVEAGLLLRFTADTIAMAPPFISSEEEIVGMIESLRGVLRRID